jgi:glycosyltransferase involved in cell wall biosynthesis
VRRLSFNLAAAPDPFRWEYDNLWVGDYLTDFLQQERPDIFHLVSGYLLTGRTLRVARELGIPTVTTLTDFWFLCRRISMLRSNNQVCYLPVDPATCARCFGEEKRRYRLPGRTAPLLMQAFWHLQKDVTNKFEARIAFLQQTLREVDMIISPSNYLRSTFIAAGVPPEQIIYSRQGHEFPHLTQELLEKTPSSHLRVGYLGQIAWHKGVHTLLQAVQKLPNLPLQVQVYGNANHFPDYANSLRRLIGDDKRLILVGSYPRDQVSHVLRNLDVIVVPSLWLENSPNVILEAFAHQTPVITTNQGGMAELVEHGRNGLLFEPGDVSSLAQQLKRLVEEPDLLQRLRAGIEPVKSVTTEIDELEGIYAHIIR